MDDSNPVIPFEFEDCDAFLASLDENSASLITQKNSEYQQTPIMNPPSLSDYVSMSAAMTDSASQPDWRLQPDAYASTQPMNLYNQTVDPFTLQQQQRQHQQQAQQHYSSHTTPLSSPFSTHSNTESDPNVLLGGSMVYPSTMSSPSMNGPVNVPYGGTGSFDAASYNSTGYPISPQYPSTQTGSSISSPDGFEYPSSSINSIPTAVPVKLIPTMIPQPQLQQLPLTQQNSIPLHSLSNGIKQESPQNLSYEYDDQAVSPHTLNSGSPEAYSPQDDSDSSPAHKSSRGVKKERQYSSSKIDTKGNRISKPKKEKTSHNMIEKRYRTNINDKILALRDCVPSLRCVVNGTPRTAEELEGLTPASKLNKATVLTKATEYILHLQKRNNMLLKELHDLQHHRTEPNGIMPNDMAPTGLPPNGIPAYPTLQSQNQQMDNSSFASKVMMCSMAGLMGAGLMNEGGDTQGLSFVPFFSYITNLRIGPWDSTSLLYAFKLSLILGTVFYVLSPYFFYSSSKTEEKSQQFTNESEADSEALSLNFELSDIRKHTWSHNSHSINLPSKSISSQISAFISTVAQIAVLKISGPESFDSVAEQFGQEHLSSQCDSISRAVDAQLCGGQPDPSNASFFFSFLKTFLLPVSPMRYFTQAMQVSVMCHETALFSSLGAQVAKYFLNKASQTALPAKESDEEEEDEASFDEFHLPKHLIALLKSKEVLNSRTTQRIYNVAFGNAVSEGCPFGDDEGYGSVVTDKSIRSANDVLAAIYANSLLHEVLLGVLENDEIDFRKLSLCAKVSPPRSIVARRVAIAEALLLGPKDASYAKNAMEMLKEELNQQAWINKEVTSGETTLAPATPAPVPQSAYRSRSNSRCTINTVTLNSDSSNDTEDESLFSSSGSNSISSEGEDNETSSESEGSISTERGNDVDFLSTSVKSNSIPFAVSQDSRLGIRFSLITCYLARNMTGPAFQLVQKVEINRLESIGILGFVAMWKVLGEMYERKFTVSRHKLEDLSAIARIWLGGNIGAEEGLSLERLRYLVGESVAMSKFFGGFDCEMDEGYGTQ